jgi:hypothetical protein
LINIQDCGNAVPFLVCLTKIRLIEVWAHGWCHVLIAAIFCWKAKCNSVTKIAMRSVVHGASCPGTRETSKINFPGWNAALNLLGLGAWFVESSTTRLVSNAMMHKVVCGRFVR